MIPGVVDSNGTWNGASGVIQRQEADFSTATSIFLERLIMSDFKQAYPADPFIIVSLKPQLLPQYLVIIRPYKVSVWIAILAVIIVWGLSLWAIQTAHSYYAKKDSMSLTTAIFFSFAVILEDPPSRPPSNFLGQMLVGWWLAVCFLLSTGYRSSLVAHLTAQGKTEPIDNYNDLVAKPQWRWGCDEVVLYGVADSYFRQSTTPVIKQVAKKVESVSVNTGLKKVLDGWYSLLTSRNRIRTEIEPKYANNYGQTPFYLSKQGYDLTPGLGWMFRKGAPFLPRFAKLTDRLIEGGIINYWLKNVMASNARSARKGNKQENKQAQTTDDTTADETKIILRMGHMIGVFLTYLVGVLISTLAFVVENVYNRFLY
ncbi:glutamate receptor-like [Macrobrachium rosenbergii]|uniref:glutamate receptor-like n=1 Tax=Macrobrachium rosenbergii TaxID=79674 RepID=UPI0034D3DE82